MQVTALIISLIGIAVVSVAFVYVTMNAAKSSDQSYPEIVKRAYGLRRWWMVSLCVLGVLVTAVTLLPYPLHAASSVNQQVINAVGGQWYWKLNKTTAQTGEPVQFHVTTVDVTHGFAIYNPHKQIIAQVQAIPGFVSKLDVVFTEAGKYRVLCLEYCGVAHHGMLAEIIVTERN